MNSKEIMHHTVIGLEKFFMPLIPIPTPTSFVGIGSTKQLAIVISGMNVQHLLIVTDRILSEIGVIKTVTKQLDQAGIKWSIYDGVQPDPNFEQVKAGYKYYVESDCDAVLAVGGGSSIDAAKVIAAMATNRKPIEKLVGNFKIRKATAPFFAIPTTAGTGSEATIASVISDQSSGVKNFFADPKLIPTAVALDPSLMTSMPSHVTAATGIDALTHAIESYLCLTATKKTKMQARTAVKLIFEYLPICYNDGNNLDARTAMALASFYAGMAFTRTGVGYVHAIAHAFGTKYHTPHGLANAVGLSHVLEFSRPNAKKQLAELADIIGLKSGTQEEGALLFIDSVRNLLINVNISPTLAALREYDIPDIAGQALNEARALYPVPRYMDQKSCEEILNRMLVKVDIKQSEVA